MALLITDILKLFPARLRLEGAAKQSIEVARQRLVLGGILFTVAFSVIALRLVELTLLKEGHEPRTAQNARSLQLDLARADIVDRNGVLLATSLPTASLYANPRMMIDPDDAIRKLSKALPGIDVTGLTAKIKSEKSFVWIRRNLPPAQQAAINRLGIPGLQFQREDRRVYPHGSLTSHVVGFADIDNRGLAGIEQHFDDRLRSSMEPLRLSIDIRVQTMVREELSKQIEEFKGIGGAGVVLDVQTGETIALVSLPDFDSNRPGTAEPDARFNRVTLGTYEPGSVFKIFNTAMALDAGVTTLRGGYDASRPIQISRFSISDYKGKNRFLTVPEIFMYSSNIGSARMAVDAGVNRQRAFLERVGMLRTPSIELPEVAHPLVPKPWREINVMTISFGHGITVSPIQLVVGVGAVVNGGTMRPATLVKRPDHEPLPGERVMSQRTSEQLRALMRLVVEKGTGKSADVEGYHVGGKTGTAEKIVNGVYKKNARISSFIGAFPMHDPRYVVFAMVDEPQGNRNTQGYATGGWVAAPMVGRIISRIAPTLGVEPVLEAPPASRDAMAILVGTRG